jgi:hypothetical protein
MATLDETLRAFIAETRTQNAFLRQNGAGPAAARGDALLDALETLLAAPRDEPTVTVEEAAALTGAHPESIRRMVRRGEVGRQRAKKARIAIPASQLPVIGAKARTPRATVQDQAARLLGA